MSSVLLVEDNEELADLVKRMLERRGHRVRVALSGRDALRLLSSGRKPDVILLDIIMPGISGEEVLLRIRGREELRDVPVYIFSVITERERIEHWYAIGATGVISKPFSIERLESAVENSEVRRLKVS